MPSATSRNVARLARLARDLESKRALCLIFEQRVEMMERTGEQLPGHRDLLQIRQEDLASALQLLESVEQARQADETAALLAEVERVLSAPEWELAELMSDELAEKHRKLRADDIPSFYARTRVWQTWLREMEEQLEAAREARAPVVREKRELQALKDRVEGTDQKLRGEQFRDARQALLELEPETEKAKQLLEGLRKKVLEARRLARQADLLLLRGPLLRQRYEYTILLRTPSEPGSHGINVQDSSTLVKQDHELFRRTTKDVTAQIDLGLARAFTLRNAAVPPAAPAAATSAANAEEPQPPAPLETGPTAQEANETRSFLPASPTPSLPPSRPVNELAQEVGDLMYRLCMPETMKPYLQNTPCSLTITTNDLELPWELMWSGEFERGFLCLDRPMARMPMGRAMPRPETSVDRGGKPLSFLLIYADPRGNLDYSRREVEQIRDGLRKEWKDEIVVDVWLREQAQGQRLNDALRKGEYDVIHYSGHAAFDVDEPDLSALLLHGRELFLAQKARRLLEGRPLVFLNACESGRSANEREPQRVGRYLQQPAEGLASSFIYGGAAGCIGALWPVYDQPAADFAIDFYNLVVEGYMIGEAMRLARIRSKEQNPTQITWASFVLYGDPTYQLR